MPPNKSESLVLSRSESQAIDKLCIEKYGIPGIVLMENAGRGVVDYFLQQHPAGKVVICCGGGNNGGDGLVVARHIFNRNIPVQVLLLTNPDTLSGDAKINFNIVMKSEIPLKIITQENLNTLDSELSQASWIIDAIFGTGLRGQVRSPYDTIINAINKADKPVLSIDIPSGLDCDTGESLGYTVKATHTVTMVAMKKGFLNAGAKKYLGEIHVVGIGAPHTEITLIDFWRRDKN